MNPDAADTRERGTALLRSTLYHKTETGALVSSVTGLMHQFVERVQRAARSICQQLLLSIVPSARISSDRAHPQSDQSSGSSSAPTAERA